MGIFLPSVEVDPDTGGWNNPYARARTKVLALLVVRREAPIRMRPAGCLSPIRLRIDTRPTGGLSPIRLRIDTRPTGPRRSRIHVPHPLIRDSPVTVGGTLYDK